MCNFRSALLCAALLYVTTGLQHQASAVVLPVTSGLVAHFDAQDASSVLNLSAAPASDGQLVGTWLGQVASNNASPSSSTWEPIYEATGAPFDRPAIAFNGTDNLVTSSAVTPRTVILFHRWDDAGNPTEYFFDFRTTVPNSYVFDQVSTALGSNFNPGYYVNGSTSLGTGLTGLQNSSWQMTTFYGTSTASDVMHMMTRYSIVNSGLGAYGEVLIYNRVITESERLQVFDYINTRWLTAPPIPAPEPSTLLLAGVSSLLFLRRRRQSGTPAMIES